MSKRDIDRFVIAPDDVKIEPAEEEKPRADLWPRSAVVDEADEEE